MLNTLYVCCTVYLYALIIFILCFFFRLYLILASNVVRPSQVYRVCVSLMPTTQPVVVRASLHRNSEQVVSASDIVDSKDGHVATLLMQVFEYFFIITYKP